MTTTYKAVLRPARKDGLQPIHLRFTRNRQSLFLTTTMATSTVHWNDRATLEKANWLRKTHPYATQYNAHLQQMLSLAQQLLLVDPLLDAATLRRRVSGQPDADQTEPVDFLTFFAQDTARREATGHPRTAEKFRSILHKLRAYCYYAATPAPTTPPTATQLEALRLPFASLTVRFIRAYEQHLKVLGNKDTTIYRELSFLNTVVRRAVEQDLLSPDHNPFARLRLSSGKSAAKTKLNELEVQLLEGLPEEMLTPGERQARDTWLLQYYLLGSRVGDVLTLRWANVHADRVEFVEHKTGKRKVAPRFPELDAVLARYAPAVPTPEAFVLPYLHASVRYAQWPLNTNWAELSRNPVYRPLWMQLLRHVESSTATVNTNLKRVATHAGIEKKLTSHTARHSFADRGRRLGIAAADMRDMLNHHSITQTEEYFGELEQSEIHNKALGIYTR